MIVTKCVLLHCRRTHLFIFTDHNISKWLPKIYILFVICISLIIIMVWWVSILHTQYEFMQSVFKRGGYKVSAYFMCDDEYLKFGFPMAIKFCMQSYFPNICGFHRNKRGFFFKSWGNQMGSDLFIFQSIDIF